MPRAAIGPFLFRLQDLISLQRLSSQSAFKKQFINSRAFFCSNLSFVLPCLGTTRVCTSSYFPPSYPHPCFSSSLFVSFPPLLAPLFSPSSFCPSSPLRTLTGTIGNGSLPPPSKTEEEEPLKVPRRSKRGRDRKIKLDQVKGWRKKASVIGGADFRLSVRRKCRRRTDGKNIYTVESCFGGAPARGGEREISVIFTPKGEQQSSKYVKNGRRCCCTRKKKERERNSPCQVFLGASPAGRLISPQGKEGGEGEKIAC